MDYRVFNISMNGIMYNREYHRNHGNIMDYSMSDNIVNKRRMGVYEGVSMNNGDNMNYSMEVWYRYG